MGRNPKAPARRTKWVVGAPEQDHPIMSELARFHAGFATLEASLILLMTFAMGRPQAMAEAIVGRIRNISDRIDIIEAVAEASDDLSGAQKTLIGAICQRAGALNVRRNVYAHGVYEHLGKKIRITAYGFSARKKQAEFLSVKRVEKDVAEISVILAMTLIATGQLPEQLLSEFQASP